MTKEQVENINDVMRAADSGEKKRKRERSTIQFPYNDLDDAVSIASAVHDNAGLTCSLDQLAAYTKQSITSGTFRLRVSNASTYGLTENERGEVRLTELGRRIVDPEKESAALADSFLTVPLFARIFENYKGFTLPGAAALEKFMRDEGVSPKQTGKARQAFLRAAKQAGFFAHGEDRLVRPALSGPGTKPIEDQPEKDGMKKRGGGSGPDDPLIQALIQKLPTAGPWTVDERVTWLKMLAMAFDITYGHEPSIEIKKEAA